ncbi:hypothetical protein FRC03_001334, partial [Tulasnella sp. 419]
MVPLLGSCLSSRMSSHLTPTFRLVGPPRISTRPEASTRKHHIRSLNDILFYSIQRHDLVRSRRAWSILARCPEVDWREMWRIGLLLCGEISSIPEGLDETTTDQDRLDYLKVAMLRHPLNRESILQDLVLELISQKRYREALDELELYLPSFPYQDNPVLQLYAGLIFLYQAQPSTTLPTNEPTQEHDGTPKSKVSFANFSKAHLRSAQRHFERARSLDPGNVVAISYLAL